MRYIILIIILVTASVFSFSQSRYEAEKLFDAGNFNEAYNMYLKLYQADTLDLDVCYHLGLCYLNFETQREKALHYLEFAAKREKPAISEDIFYYLGVAYFHAEKFDIALAYFERYNGLIRNKFGNEAKNYIRYCRNAKALTKQPLEIKFINLGDKINTKYPEYTPYITSNDELLVFASKREIDFTEIYMSYKNWRRDDSWEKSKSQTSKIKAPYDAYVAGIAPEGTNLLIHYADFSPVKDVDICQIQGHKFGELLNMGEPINTTEYSEQGACMSKNGDTLFFASNKPEGFGGFDIYYSIKLPNGEWGLPRNLGATINTEFDENYPNYTDSLIFCSNGHTSMGGYDLFSSKFDSNQTWSEPRNLGYPINNTYDNTTLSMLNQRYGYISTYRADSYGSFDIYKIVIMKSENPRLVYKGKVMVNNNEKLYPITDFDSDININVYNSDTGDLYGRYSVKKQTSSYVISLIPGRYILKIESLVYESVEKVLIVPNSVPPEGENINEEDLIVKLKENKK